MKLIIEIPEYLYKAIKAIQKRKKLTEEQEAIANGIPLDNVRDKIESQREEVCKNHSENDVLLTYYFGLNDGLKDARDILDNYIATSNTKYRKEWFAKVRSEIEELARFHSTDVPMVYGDGTETIDKMVSLEELGRIFAEIEDAIGGKL